MSPLFMLYAVFRGYMRLYTTDRHAYRTEEQINENKKFFELIMHALYRLKPHLGFILRDGTVTAKLIEFVSVLIGWAMGADTYRRVARGRVNRSRSTRSRQSTTTSRQSKASQYLPYPLLEVYIPRSQMTTISLDAASTTRRSDANYVPS